MTVTLLLRIPPPLPKAAEFPEIVLETTFTGSRPGLVMFYEDFAKATVTAKLVGASRRRERRGFGMGHEWRVRRETEADFNRLKPTMVRIEATSRHSRTSLSLRRPMSIRLNSPASSSGARPSASSSLPPSTDNEMISELDDQPINLEAIRSNIL